jgi:hypothetical protein
MLPTGTMPTAVFHLPNGATAAATMIHKLHHNLREPARSINIVPCLVGNSLLSTVKMVEAGYTAIYDDKEVNFYDTLTTKSRYWQMQSSKGGNAHRPNSGVFPLFTTTEMKNGHPPP